MRGATLIAYTWITVTIFQSTLLMRGATSRAGGRKGGHSVFQSTLLMRGATGARRGRAEEGNNFNPRSSCEERHGLCPFCDTGKPHFNPRSSCEERLDAKIAASKNRLFQSTLLMRGATWPPMSPSSTTLFQSTLLMRGATRGYCHA